MADGKGEDGDRRDGKPSNPFKMPSDEEIFSLRDDERARKEEERKNFLKLPVSKKTTWSSRAASTSRNILKDSEDEALRGADGKKGKFGGLGAAADNAYRQERHREKENMTDFIEKKRQMFLVQMSLDTKRAEIRKLEEQAQQREEALRNSEQMLEADAHRFESFLKKNDQQAVQAIKHAETETKAKQDKVQEIKKLTAQIAAVNSETTKYAESLDECQSYKKFLDDLTPQEWIKEQYELHEKENQQKRQARKEARQQAREIQDRQAEDELKAEIEAMRAKAPRSDSVKKMIQQKEAEFEAEKERRTAEREREDTADQDWDPDQGVKWEPPTYFTRPQQLLDIFAALEERNLFLIQNSQETEEQLEELKQKLEMTKAKMSEETELLNSQINSLKAQIAAEEAKAGALGERGNPHKGQNSGDQDIEALLASLHKRVAEVRVRVRQRRGRVRACARRREGGKGRRPRGAMRHASPLCAPARWRGSCACDWSRACPNVGAARRSTSGAVSATTRRLAR